MMEQANASRRRTAEATGTRTALAPAVLLTVIGLLVGALLWGVGHFQAGKFAGAATTTGHVSFTRPYKTSSSGPVKRGYVEPQIAFTAADGSQHTFWSHLKERRTRSYRAAHDATYTVEYNAKDPSYARVKQSLSRDMIFIWAGRGIMAISVIAFGAFLIRRAARRAP